MFTYKHKNVRKLYQEFNKDPLWSVARMKDAGAEKKVHIKLSSNL